MKLTPIYQQIIDVRTKLKIKKPCPIMLVGNKCDLENEIEVTEQDAMAKAQEWNCKFMKTSAKTKENIQETFYSVAKDLVEIRDDEKH